MSFGISKRATTPNQKHIYVSSLLVTNIFCYLVFIWQPYYYYPKDTFSNIKYIFQNQISFLTVSKQNDLHNASLAMQNFSYSLPIHFFLNNAQNNVIAPVIYETQYQTKHFSKYSTKNGSSVNFRI